MIIHKSFFPFLDKQVMKDKRLLISWPLAVITTVSYIYIYRSNPLDNEIDFGLINLLALLLVIIVSFLLKGEFKRHIAIIILLLIFIGIYFLI